MHFVSFLESPKSRLDKLLHLPQRETERGVERESKQISGQLKLEAWPKRPKLIATIVRSTLQRSAQVYCVHIKYMVYIDVYTGI